MPRWKPPSADELYAGIESMARQGQGVWTIELYPAAQLLELFSGDVASDETWEARECFRMMAEAVVAATKAAPRLCLTCDNGFDREHWPVAIVIMRPSVPETSARLVQGLCADCCGLDEAVIQTAVLDALGRYTGQGGMRVIQPHPEHRA